MTRREYLRETTRDHHPLGPSSLGLAHSCPGSHREQKGLPDRTTAAATEGTRLHSLFGLVIGGEMKLDQIDSDVDSELARRCFDFLLALRLELDISGCKTYVEERLALSAERWGYGDVVLHDPEKKMVAVVDWKSGWKSPWVKAATLQLADLMRGIRDFLFDGEEHEFRGYVYSPRIDNTVKVTFDDASVAMCDATVEAALKPDAPLVPGEHCQYCRAAGRCDATRGEAEKALDLVKAAPAGGTLMKVAVSTEISALPMEKLAWLADRLPVLEAIVAGTKDAIRAELKSDPGTAAELGYEIKVVGGQRQCISISQLRKKVRSRLKALEFLECCKPSIPEIERLWVGLRPDDQTKQEAEKAFAELTQGCVQKGVNEQLRRVKR